MEYFLFFLSYYLLFSIPADCQGQASWLCKKLDSPVIYNIILFMKYFILILLVVVFVSCEVNDRRIIHQVRFSSDEQDKQVIEEQYVQMQTYVRKHPYDPDARRWLGNFYLYRKSDPKKALSEFRVYVRLEPENPRAHFKEGEALMQMNKYDEAIICLEKSIECDPGYAVSYETLARLYHKIGDYTRSEIYLKKFRKLRKN